MRLFCPLRLVSTGMLLAWSVFTSAQNSGATTQPGGSIQEEKSNRQAPLFRSTANLVTVDVVVTHNGRPITGLQQDAFHILEDGREQTIKIFEEHAPASDTPLAENSNLPSHTYSNAPEASGASAVNVLLLDALNTPAEDQAYARRKIIEYLKTIPPGTRMAVFTLGSRLRLVQGFTADSSVLLAALNKTQPVTSPALAGNKGESAADRLAELAVAQAPMNSQTAMNTVVQSLQQFELDEDASLLDRRIQITLDALKQLALYLGALPGRKNVIWFSASFPISVTPEFPLDAFKSLRGYAPQLQQVSDLLTASRVAVYPVDARGLITTAPNPNQNHPAAVALGGGGMRTGMIDPSAFPTAPASGNRNDAEFATMLQLAEQTGGTPFYNSNALKQALAKAIENGSSYYTLAYSPEDKNFDGKFRKIQIKLAGHDYHLAYRHGYYEEAPVAHGANALLSLAAPALQADALPSSQILFHARVLSVADPEARDLQPHDGPAGDLAAKLKPPVTRYWIEYTADMHQVRVESGADGLNRSLVEFIVIAYDRDGKVVNAGRRSFKLNLPQARYEEILRTGFSVRNEIDLPEGDLWLRLAVHDVAADRVGSIGVPLEVHGKNTN